MKYIYPNFKENIVNIAATFAEFLGIKTGKPQLSAITKELAKDYKNIVFICFDGLGIYPLEKSLSKSDLLRKSIKQVLTSTFPSTTTNATTTLITAKTPNEHGWFAWSLYIKQLNRVVDLYRNKDHYTEELIAENYIENLLPKSVYYKDVISEYEVNEIQPPYCKSVINNSFHFETVEHCFEIANSICQKQGKQFIYIYNPEPDSHMHNFGVCCNSTKNLIKTINNSVESFMKKNKDTLIVISADHGQVDVSGYIKLFEDKELQQYFGVPAFGDGRSVFVKIKKGKNKLFEQYIKNNYYKDMDVFLSVELFNQGVFGEPIKSIPSIKELLGEYILVPKNFKQIMICENEKKFKGSHSGLAKEEMLVPLIVLGDK